LSPTGRGEQSAEETTDSHVAEGQSDKSRKVFSVLDATISVFSELSFWMQSVRMEILGSNPLWQTSE
jgi:hypothetical protein